MIKFIGSRVKVWRRHRVKAWWMRIEISHNTFHGKTGSYVTRSSPPSLYTERVRGEGEVAATLGML